MYPRLKWLIRNNAMRDFTRQRLIALVKQLDETLPDKDAENNLLLATWNIRDFGKINRRGFGNRLPDSFFYIAEIISRFDFVAIQEVNELDEWEEVMNILGPSWDYIATDVTDTKLGGNGERLTYAFDRRKVRFLNIAGEIVLPADMLISRTVISPEGEKPKLYAGKQFRRTPFCASFQAGWLKFDICTVHIFYGAESGVELEERTEEIARIAGYLAKRADRELKKGRLMILLGDFNIVHPEHKTMQALTSNGFIVPKSLQNTTNLGRDKYYDQIAFKTDSELIAYVDQPASDKKKRYAGIVEIFESLYLPDHFSAYEAAVTATANGKKKTGAKLKDYYQKEWATYQLSDHKPLWVRLKINDSLAYLEGLTI